MNSAARSKAQPISLPAAQNRLCYFLTEMRRRRVCRAITMYSVAMWLTCQIVDVVSPALELPDWTLKLVIVLGLIGLPVIIIMSWLFEITPDGLVAEAPEALSRNWPRPSTPKHIADRLIDGSLILAALAIGVQLAVGTLLGETAAKESVSQKIAVMPLRANAGEDAASFSEGLGIELQHALRDQPGVTVIASTNAQQLMGSMSLTGAVTTSDTLIRVTMTMVDFETGEVVWSAAFELPRSGNSTLSAELAHQIVAALPSPHNEAEPARFADVIR